MTMSEFIEMTGFKPTGEEYAEIEAEYMGCDEDKDTFCKQWKKHYGVERLMRMRARKIEELESRVRTVEREWESRFAEMVKSKNEWKKQAFENAQLVTRKKEEIADLEKRLRDVTKAYERLVEAVKVIKEVEA